MSTLVRVGLLIAALAAVAWLVSPVVAIVVAVALAGEDLWGWFSGRRASLAEDLLGPRWR